MAKMIIESSDPNDTPVMIEERLEKALSAIQIQREGNRQFTDNYLRDIKGTADAIVSKIIDNMISEIEQVL